MAGPRVKVLYHDNCFDGAASASLFSRYFASHLAADADFEFSPKHHAQGDVYSSADFDGDVHVVVDFRYSPHPRLDWWFDHHVSAFQTRADESHFHASMRKEPTARPHHFYDPEARSCAKLLATTLADRFGWDAGPHSELVDGADVIDGAQFESPAVAVALEAPALRLMTWVESNHDPELKVRFIEDLTRRDFADIAASGYVSDALVPVLARHAESVALLRSRAVLSGGVVSFDVADEGLHNHNKFIPYYLHPACVYVVGVTASAERAKVSVGYNPWSGRPRGVSIAEICERYGGGGHPVVGAVSFPRAELSRVRSIAQEITELLRSSILQAQGG